MNIDLLKNLRADFPQFNFVAGEDFHWNSETQTVFFTDSPFFEEELLHELGHAINSDENFNLDIELLKMETKAWDTAQKLSNKYNINIRNEIIENHLDTYRDWIHKRSLCPNCLINGFQKNDLSYKCPGCGLFWKNNDSRFKNLRRIIK